MRYTLPRTRTALTLMEDAAAPREAAEPRLATLLDQGVALQNVKGPGSAEVGAVYARARALCPGLASPRQNFAVLWGLWRHRAVRGELPAARVLADELLESTQAKNDAEFELQALHAAWTTARFQGDLALAAAHARRGIALSRPESVSAPFFAFSGHHPTVCARGALAQVLRLQGFAEQSRDELGKACALAEELGHVPTIADALHNLLDAELVSRDPATVRAPAARLAALAEAHGLAMFRAVSRFAEAWCASRLGNAANSIGTMQDALEAMRDTGHREPYYVVLLGETLAAEQRWTEADRAFDEALAGVRRNTTGHWAEAEARRLLAETLLAGSRTDQRDAEEHFREALRIARSHGAHLIELRAATALCRLLSKSGRSAEGKRELRQVYAQFTEGLDTPDLAAARALLGRPRGRSSTGYSSDPK